MYRFIVTSRLTCYRSVGLSLLIDALKRKSLIRAESTSAEGGKGGYSLLTIHLYVSNDRYRCFAANIQRYIGKHPPQ